MTYRLPARAEIVLRGHSRATVYACAVWLSFAAFAVVTYYLGSPSYIRVSIAGIVAVFVLSVLVVRHAANKVRWRVSLEQSTLCIERVGSRSAELATLDVSDGVYIATGVSDGLTSIDPCVVLSTRAWRIELPAGHRPAEVVHELVQFLERHEVPVTDDRDAPVGPPGAFH